MKLLKSILRPAYHRLMRAARAANRLALRLLRAMLGQKLFFKLVGAVREDSNTVVEIAGFAFDAGDPIPFYRAVTLLTKEPDTICWIDEFIGDGSVFFDVGANVGVFSLYAARKGATVIAFEPFFENYALLNRNIALNRMGSQISALNLAIHDSTTFSHLNVSGLQPGKAGHSFQAPIGSTGEAYAPVFSQAVLGFDLGTLVTSFALPKPNFVKIDVDGNDHLVARGMASLMRDPELRGIAIELNIDERQEDRDIVEWIIGFGFDKLTEPRFTNWGYIDLGMKSRNHFFKRPG